MGTDYFSQSHYVIDPDTVEKEASTPWKLFMGEVANIAKDIGSSPDGVLANFVQVHDSGYDMGELSENQLDLLESLYKELTDEFKAKTGMGLYAGYVGEGLRGSDLHDEVFWGLDDVMTKTKAAIAFEKKYKTTLTLSVHQDCG